MNSGKKDLNSTIEAEKRGINQAQTIEYIKKTKQGGDLLSPDQKHI